MAVTSGFFNSLNNDRLYDAATFNSLFDILYNEGVFQNTGNAFQVTAPSSSESNRVYVGSGVAWFDNSWIKNDATIAVTLQAPSTTQKRYDAVVLDIDTTDGTRSNTIQVVTGTPASSPSYPSLANETHHKQHPLAYILRNANTPRVTSANITDERGQSTTTPPTPWTTLKMSSDIAFLQDTIAAFTNIGYTGGSNINGLLKFTGQEFGKRIEIKKLLHNSSHTSKFTNRNPISAPGISECDLFIITYKTNKDGSSYVVLLNMDGANNQPYRSYLGSTATDYRRSNTISKANGTITFSAAYSNSSTADDYMIPLDIYGVKWVQDGGSPL